MAVKKLIEVALPLDAINDASSKEKYARTGNPATLHLWWARRPLATARAVIWASLVDDPSSHPDLFPNKTDQDAERARLFGILEQLVRWESITDSRVLNSAKDEIIKSIGNELPSLLDPFAGGGAIPLEAQRLGLESYAQDLNPVAVSINKALIEIPFVFQDRAAVNPESQRRRNITSWDNNAGIVADIEYYGTVLKESAFKKLEKNYPYIDSNDGTKEKVTPIAWIWTRTIKCPNPACSCDTPLVRSFDLSKKRGDEYHIEAIVEGKRLSFQVQRGKSKRPGTINRKGAVCIQCGMPIAFPYIREEGAKQRINHQMMAVVGQQKRGRVYLTPSEIDISGSQVDRPELYPDGEIAKNPRNFNTLNYGLDTFEKLFTNRQMLLLTTLTSILDDIQDMVRKDAINAGYDDNHTELRDGGTGALAYSEAIKIYLALAIDYCGTRYWTGKSRLEVSPFP